MSTTILVVFATSAIGIALIVSSVVVVELLIADRS
jgi:hypothetical protein